jgi:hypothetical protein
MPVEWRPPGDGMGTVDLSELRGDQIVIHFGGAVTSVDAYTFGNSLVAFADTIRAVNGVVNPNQNIEIRLEALGPGSFRAVVKRISKGLGGIFTRGAEAVFWGVIATLIYEHLIKNDPKVKITVNADQVIIEKGGDTIIVPRNVYDQMPNVRKNAEVQKNLSKTFQVIEEDLAIENFGLTPHLNDTHPLVQIPRTDFPVLATMPAIVEPDSRRRSRTERVRVVILKAWLMAGGRKWSFEWNGVPISAPIKDDTFFARLASHEIVFGQGDALDIELQYQQEYDDALGIFVNDPHTFEVVRVIRLIPRSQQLVMPPKG